MKENRWCMILGIGISACLLPVILTLWLAGPQVIRNRKTKDPEKLIPVWLMQEISPDAEEEMLKVQAVLIRSSLYFSMEEGTFQEELEAAARKYQQMESTGDWERMQKAAKATEGQIMTWQGKVCRGVFHRISAGGTREGEELGLGEAMGYLTGVDSSGDQKSDGYFHGHYFTEDALRIRLQKETGIRISEESVMDQIQITGRDSRGYVTAVSIGNETIRGERFRRILGLSSAHFTMQKMDGRVRFLCEGVGHGLGLSQYGANTLAKEGKKWKEILRIYFPKIEIRHV